MKQATYLATLPNPNLKADEYYFFWIYPAVMCLYGMGFVDTLFLGMRPWTRLSVAHHEYSVSVLFGPTKSRALIQSRAFRGSQSDGSTVAECNHWIDPRGSPRWYITGEQGHQQ